MGDRLSHGFVVERFGDGDEERQPDVRYTWRPAGAGDRLLHHLDS